MIPTDQSPNTPLPTRDSPGGPFTIPFEIADRSSWSPPIGTDNFDRMQQELTKRLTPNYETTERVELMAIQTLAGEVARHLLAE